MTGGNGISRISPSLSSEFFCTDVLEQGNKHIIQRGFSSFMLSQGSTIYPRFFILSWICNHIIQIAEYVPFISSQKLVSLPQKMASYRCTSSIGYHILDGWMYDLPFFKQDMFISYLSPELSIF
jgi:hypothetical protein